MTFENSIKLFLALIIITFFLIKDDCETSCEAHCSFKFNVDKLYKTICKLPNTDEVTLLLYMLLHRNPSFKQHIMKRPDIQLLVSVL